MEQQHNLILLGQGIQFCNLKKQQSKPEALENNNKNSETKIIKIKKEENEGEIIKTTLNIINNKNKIIIIKNKNKNNFFEKEEKCGAENKAKIEEKHTQNKLQNKQQLNKNNNLSTEKSSKTLKTI
uniref:Uncharacterized protein n=1 Tax=Meloidogyne hapla TaxID=6305 RepID=A0A1I8BLM5_MELHA